MSKKPIVFKCEDSMWQMLADGTKTWDARKDDMGDDRVYRLHWKAWDPQAVNINTRKPYSTPVEKNVSFLNKQTGETLTFRFDGLEFSYWAPGWMFIQLGGLVWRT